ncbi:MAG TPA: glycoside hydrolase family 3 C-terminal domain-containing protein [Solirubrobacteraceae bacterium]|nr:glycoside hydrolase family 3 C-terminal domain-containing protein [Solirubrobacteraceae bacterium]
MAAADVLGKLTIAEKAALCVGRDFWSMQGVERLGVPSIVLTDGPHGVRRQAGGEDGGLRGSAPATCFPTGSALAATWDVALLEEVGEALGREARALGVSVLLGPGANLKRTPLCGRDFEYLSEDPLLSGELAGAWIRGVQAQGVAASLKHYAANNQEHRRYSVDALIDERALRELYLASWERAVATGRPWTVMAAYNRLNGEYCTESRFLLTEVLRDQWGFDGIVMSDWGAVDERVPALAAGLDLEMPGYGGGSELLIARALADGRLAEATLDRSVARLLALIDRTAGAREEGHGYDADAHHELARRASAAATVLLKNAGGLLPLAPGADLAVVGAFAAEPRYQGAGSSGVTPHRVEAALPALGDGVPYAPGYDIAAEAPDPALLEQAREVARGRDAVVVFAGLTEAYETEGYDRRHLRLPPAHDALIEAVAEVNEHVVVVLANGAPVELPWRDRVPAIVEGYLGGQAGGRAVADVLTGAAEPGGRLAETFPARWEEHPLHGMPMGPRVSEYRESLYVGYRAAGVDEAFPFGHGLSYTTFSWSEPAVDAHGSVPDAEDLAVTVTLTVTNTGERAGSDVVQLYVHDAESTAFRPEHELRAFAKVQLEPGASEEVALRLDRRAFAFWDPGHHDWVVEPGRFELRAGASARDIRGVAAVEIAAGPATLAPSARAAVPGPAPPASRGAFAALLDRALPENGPDTPGGFTRNTPLSDMRRSPVIRAVGMAMRRHMTDADGRLEPLFESMLDDGVPRMLPMLTRNAVTRDLAEGLVALANGRAVGGVRRSLSAVLERLSARG